MRHAAVITAYDPKPGVSIATLAYDYPARHNVPEHAHGAAQLIYAISGVMHVFAGQGMWLIPPACALWIPARTAHRIRMPQAVSMRTLYLRPNLAARPEAECAVLHVMPLLRELIVEAVRKERLRAGNSEERALRDVLVGQIRKASPVPASIMLPRDERALAVAHLVLRDPAGSRSMPALCEQAGVSTRTLERIFAREVGTPFAVWRRQVRLTRAVELLVSGASVKQAAYEAGFGQPSGLVEVFRQTFGATPKAWISALQTHR